MAEGSCPREYTTGQRGKGMTPGFGKQTVRAFNTFPETRKGRHHRPSIAVHAITPALEAKGWRTATSLKLTWDAQSPRPARDIKQDCFSPRYIEKLAGVSLNKELLYP